MSDQKDEQSIHLTAIQEDGARSRYIQELIASGADDAIQDGAVSTPRVLVQFWDSTNVPRDVRECVDSWEPLTKQGFKRYLFNDKSAERFIAEQFDDLYSTAFKLCKHPAMRSDYFRLCFILKNGGFYVDADDVYKGGPYEHWFKDARLRLQPLCYDIDAQSMVKITEDVLKKHDTKRLIFYVNNNPLIAPPEHPIIREALERATRLLLVRKSNARDVQAITGPGNLTYCLARHAIESERAGMARNYAFVADWGDVVTTRWPLEYRDDQRNWRNWTSTS